ncbi:hypothetical protein SAY87_020323 [Trapa incisa]|uniref:DUF6821 domain-containing protein n=1 Tax=Trapa incisa TaxID=236973 RepID=A0AAN7K7G7_9MYRT|nr:hypothetical protein SAY87_020323 [Trapa incisa]
MDLHEWELLPIEGFHSFSDDSEERSLLSSKRTAAMAADSLTFFTLDLDHFRCPPPTSRLSPPPPGRIVPVRILLDPPIRKGPAEEGDPISEDQETVSQVSFKKMKENEFVDMKKVLESPRSAGSRPISPPLEHFQFVEKLIPDACSQGSSPEMDSDINLQDLTGEEASRGGLSLWKLGLTGIGAICSFGLAAATICAFIIIGSHQNSKQSHRKIRLQIYSDNKRIKQVVHHATKLKEAISAGGGSPPSRAQITSGGYYQCI